MLGTDLAVVAHRRHVPLRPGPGVFLVSPRFLAKLPRSQCWVHEYPLWVLACLLEEVPSSAPGRDPNSAPSKPHSSPAQDAAVAESCVIFPGAHVGPACRLEPHVVLYGGVRLGRGVQVGAGTVIGRPGFGWVFGPGGARRRMPQPGGVVVGDGVEIGPLCTIDSGTIAPTSIGARTALDAHVHVGHNVTIGEDCLVAAQVGFAGSVTLGNRVLVGGKAGFSENVTVGSDVQVAAKAGVIRDVPDGAAVAGFPAVSRLRWLAAVTRLLRTSPGE